MCACSHDFTCARCKGTPFDPRYFDDEPVPVTEDAFGDLVHEPRLLPPIMFGDE